MDTLLLNLNVHLFPYWASSFLTNPVLASLSHLTPTLTRQTPPPNLEFRTNASRPLCDKSGGSIIIELARLKMIIYSPDLSMKCLTNSHSLAIAWMLIPSDIAPRLKVLSPTTLKQRTAIGLSILLPKTLLSRLRRVLIIWLPTFSPENPLAP